MFYNRHPPVQVRNKWPTLRVFYVLAPNAYWNLIRCASTTLLLNGLRKRRKKFFFSWLGKRCDREEIPCSDSAEWIDLKCAVLSLSALFVYCDEEKEKGRKTWPMRKWALWRIILIIFRVALLLLLHIRYACLWAVAASVLCGDTLD